MIERVCVCTVYLVEHSFALLAEFGEARGGGGRQGWDWGGGQKNSSLTNELGGSIPHSPGRWLEAADHKLHHVAKVIQQLPWETGIAKNSFQDVQRMNRGLVLRLIRLGAWGSWGNAVESGHRLLQQLVLSKKEERKKKKTWKERKKEKIKEKKRRKKGEKIREKKEAKREKRKAGRNLEKGKKIRRK